ncbi:hypothetical protein HYH03_002571 [Edaphochlamys debaryana]|uniref:Flavin-containing monooxygenase n=1 Tax=Edaphochlamys debaryana TaxID=47281 RepID=A0A836C5E1_9CHLO|nr:hypothetical protein HYH03_002571 [Edaphochlamys debaryana]|eukprot:KAG2499632.1 hypothetical protein HYH03_002571 [Edaphochlamys debaryana]
MSQSPQQRKGESVGGVWRRNYHGYALQVPHSFFTFPEYPYAAAPPELRRRAEAEVYPTGPLVQEYIASYCARFRLQRHLVLGARVLHIGSQPGGRWAVRYRQLPGGGAQLAPSHAHASTASTASGMAPSPRAQPGPAAAVAAAAAAALGGPQQAQQAQQAGEAAGGSAGVSRQPTHADSFLMGTQGHVGALGEEEGQGREVEVVADVVVCATGMYYTPYVPPIPGLASFTGPALHVRDFPSLDLVRGKRVLVVGAGKSALDAAVAAASAAAGAAAVTSLFRAAHWPLPRRVLGLPFQRVLYTRFAAAMLPPYYTAQGRPSKALRHALLAPLKALFWRALQADVAARMGLRGPLKPGRGFVEDMFYGGQIQDGSWNEAVRSGCISAVQGHLAAVTPGGVRLADGRELGCDVIIFATGYTKDYSLLDPDTLRRLTAAGGEGEGAGGGAHAAEATDAAGKHGASGRKGADGAAPGAEGEGDGGQAGAGRGGGGGGRGGSVDGDAGSSGAGAGAEGEGVHLYRSMLCPGVPNLYFIGSEAASLNNVLTSGLQSLWLLHRLTAALALPSEQDMEQDIAAQRRWRRRVMPAQRHSSAVIILYQQR